MPAQLMMVRRRGYGEIRGELPEGYSFSRFREGEEEIWCEVCKRGLISDDSDVSAFDEFMCHRAGLDIFRDIFFLDFNGRHVGTVCSYVREEDGVADLHMVSIIPEFRGKGLSAVMTAKAIENVEDKAELIELTTDDWRIPAIKGYITAGFLPVQYYEDMEPRWREILKILGIPEIRMLNRDGTDYKIISAAE